MVYPGGVLCGTLLLQAAVFLPHVPALPPGGGDPAYRARFEETLGQEEWQQGQILGLRPATPPEEQVLAGLLFDGGPRQVKLAAYAAGGCAADSGLTLALLHAACESRDPAAALAALLAPEALPDELLPATALLALDSERSLGFRAAACARLLEAGCAGAWPLARSILRSGTGFDEDPPWALWRRDGRYELPKRLLTLSLDRIFAARGLPPCAFEPNAPWEDQERALVALEERMPQALFDGSPAAQRPSLALARLIAAMLRHGAAGRPRILRAIGLLSPRALPVLRLALQRPEAELRGAAHRTLELLPR